MHAWSGGKNIQWSRPVIVLIANRHWHHGRLIKCENLHFSLLVLGYEALSHAADMRIL